MWANKLDTEARARTHTQTHAHKTGQNNRIHSGEFSTGKSLMVLNEDGAATDTTDLCVWNGIRWQRMTSGIFYV